LAVLRELTINKTAFNHLILMFTKGTAAILSTHTVELTKLSNLWLLY